MLSYTELTGTGVGFIRMFPLLQVGFTFRRAVQSLLIIAALFAHTGDSLFSYNTYSCIQSQF